MFLAVHANPNNVLANFEVSSAFLNAELSDDVVILTQPAPDLIQLGLVKPGTPCPCTIACYGLQGAPRLREEARDKTLFVFTFELRGENFHLRQSAYHSVDDLLAAVP